MPLPTFYELPIRNGVGPVHLNRFRTRIKPRPGVKMPSGLTLAESMPTFMDARTATVWRDAAHSCYGRPTLMFRGVARIRPFVMLGSIPLPLPDWVPDAVKNIGVPDFLRDWMMPDVHTDSVGLVSLRPTAFTAQTLRRGFETGDDGKIRAAVHAAFVLAVAPIPALAALVAVYGQRLSKPLADIAIDINQYHFLAGRRSFHMGTAADFGEKGDHWVFETAAAERYSHDVFKLTTDFVMGGAHSTVTPVWRQMGAKVAHAYGTMIGGVEDDSKEVASVGAIARDPYYQKIAKDHPALLP